IVGKIGVVGAKGDANVNDGPIALARPGQQPARRGDQRRAVLVAVAQPDADLALGMQHIVLIVQRQKNRRRAQKNTSRMPNTPSQLTRLTRLSTIFQPPSSVAASLWNTVAPNCRCSRRHSVICRLERTIRWPAASTPSTITLPTSRDARVGGCCDQLCSWLRRRTRTSRSMASSQNSET